MTLYLVKWAAASLLMPIFTLLIGKGLNDIFVLIFWPGAITLMSLGAEKKSIITVVLAWGIGVSLNVLLYVVLGVVTYYIFKFDKGCA